MENDVSLLNSDQAQQFIDNYKKLLSEVAGSTLDSQQDYAEARGKLYEDNLNKTFQMSSPDYSEEFINAVRKAKYGIYIYAKKYKQGYAMKGSDAQWVFVTALTTPFEEMMDNWIIVDTAILPIHGVHLCDGLISHRNVWVGKNMKHDMIQELKIARKRKRK